MWEVRVCVRWGVVRAVVTRGEGGEGGEGGGGAFPSNPNISVRGAARASWAP